MGNLKQMEIPTTPNMEDAQAVNINQTNHLSDQEKNLQLGACIMAAIDAEANFKLYSYRVISPEQFQERQKEIAQLTLKAFK